MTEAIKEKFGNDIRNMRTEKNITQIACAKHCEVSIVSFQNWERGICEPKKEKMKLLCEFLGLNQEDYQ